MTLDYPNLGGPLSIENLLSLYILSACVSIRHAYSHAIFYFLNRTSWVVQSAKGGRKLHLIIYPETRNLSKIQHGLSMTPLMRLKVSLMQTYHGDSVGH